MKTPWKCKGTGYNWYLSLSLSLYIYIYIMICHLMLRSFKEKKILRYFYHVFGHLRKYWLGPLLLFPYQYIFVALHFASYLFLKEKNCKKNHIFFFVKKSSKVIVQKCISQNSSSFYAFFELLLLKNVATKWWNN